MSAKTKENALGEKRESSLSLSTIGSFTDTKFFTLEIQEVVQEEPATIIMPLDASPASEQCLMFYLKFLHKPGNMVHVIFVIDDYFKTGKETTKKEKAGQKGGTASPEPLPGKKCCSCGSRKTPSSKIVIHEVGASPGVLAELARTDRIKSHFMKSKVKSLFKINGVAHQYHRLLGNDKPATIIKFSVEQKGDLIVMGSRGLGAIKRRVLGSVTDKVVKGGTIPVLVINCKEQQQQPYTTKV